MLPGLNPATWMLEVTGGARSVTVKAVSCNWPQWYKESALGQKNDVDADNLIERDKGKEPLSVPGGTYACGFGAQVKALWRKYNVAYWRTPSYNYLRFVCTVLVAIVYGSLYYMEGKSRNPMPFSSIQSIGGVISSAVTYLGITAMLSIMPLIGQERVVYYREQAAAYYDPWAFGIVISIVELPYQLAQTAVFTGIIYPMLGFQNTALSFFYFFCVTLQYLMLYVAFGSALMYGLPNEALALIVALGINFMWGLFNGYAIPFQSIPIYWKWMNRISPQTWMVYGLVVDQLGGDPSAMVSGILGPPTSVPDYMNSVFGYEYSFRGWCVLILLAYVLVFRLISILSQRYVSYLKR